MYFASAEQPQYLDLLIENGVRHVAISYFEWVRRHDDDRLPRDLEIVITPGISKKPNLDFEEFARGFCDFADAHADHAVIYDFDSTECPLKVRQYVRTALQTLPNTVVFPFEDETLEELALEYPRIGVNASLAKSMAFSELYRIHADLYGSNVLDMRKLKAFTATTTMAWLSPRRYGEMWVFAGGHLWHHQAAQLQRATRHHRRAIEGLGMDPDRLSEADKDHLTSLAIKSILAASEKLSGRRRDQAAAITTVDVSEPAQAPQERPDAIRASVDAHPAGGRSLTLLPVLKAQEEADQLGLASVPTSMRRCDSCNISGACPAYEADAACKYSLPVSLNTRADVQASMRIVLETQFSRMMFSHFGDEVDGGTPSKSTGIEIDRYMRILKEVKEIEHIDPPKPTEGALSKALASVEMPTYGDAEIETDETDTETIEAEIIDVGFADEQTSTEEEDRTKE